MTSGFESGFLRSTRFRRLPKLQVEAVIDRIYMLREVTSLKHEEIWEDWQRQIKACVSAGADLISEARRLSIAGHVNADVCSRFVVQTLSSVCWPQPSTMVWSSMPSSKAPWENYRLGPFVELTIRCRMGQSSLNQPVGKQNR